ncbi:bifunctional methylenetetrahydrofolate dehydrogenase/methenyltetrahydrofolate cyclohydrolase FolD [Basilea psittacipulmonis]|uniref:Bifunctional protein FolD n=1 Tax=Basilea psittacipulmonis DSM 24701 TaxID=1072685 RepID=A0A077DD63_9BURK|nr:bifunctional methylenetetrahydrofolate dehydrogenase/methenyltetrahydrofolate cyclohydrolase FolD [Basilea psittacipulmonis]AIL32544.1 methenyltetrahydrofolate cyclohydrolase [Basilea psittacipulmonis DSM 24701]
MNAQILSGPAIAEEIKNELQPRIEALKAKGIIPSLTVILVGDDPASQVYVNNKHNTFIKMGLSSQVERFPSDLSEKALCQRIQALNQDPSVHGILVQLPLPKHINPQKVIATIDPNKDVDGFHVANAGALMIGQPKFIPCTPYGIMKMIEKTNVTVRGAEAVVIGASNIVGKPIALLLQAAGATVTICNSKTKDLAAHTKRADILVVAVGKPKMITGDMIKPNSVVIDVGINRGEDGKLCGDVDEETAKEVAGYITPVPGGVGVMTITMLLVNTIEAAEKTLTTF